VSGFFVGTNNSTNNPRFIDSKLPVRIFMGMKRKSLVTIRPDWSRIRTFFDPIPEKFTTDTVEVPDLLMLSLGSLLSEFGIYHRAEVEDIAAIILILRERVRLFNDSQRQPGQPGRPVRFPLPLRVVFRDQVAAFIQSDQSMQRETPGRIAYFIGSLFALCGFLQTREQFRAAAGSSYRIYLIRLINQIH